MRSSFALTSLLVLAAGVAVETAHAQDIATEKGKLSYAVGWDLGADISRRGEDFDVEALISAIRDSVAGRDPQVETAEMRRLLTELQEKVRAEQLAALQQLAEENQAKAEAFLEKNRDGTGIVVLPSGVQYRIIEEGDGNRPSLGDSVSLHVRTSRIDGIELESTFARGVPLETEINEGLLPGWLEILPLMKVGSTWQIFVPPELAFGQRGNPPAIGPNEALMFDLKLLAIVDE